MQNIKITLAAARVNAGLTQEEVAIKLGVTRATVASWEKKGVVSVPITIALSKLYDMPQDCIFFGQKIYNK